MFGLKQVEKVCKNLEIQLIIRGHQAPMNGYEFFGPKMCTLFSAPGYRGVDREANFGKLYCLRNISAFQFQVPRCTSMLMEISIFFE